MTTTQHTPLHQQHLDLGGKMVDFAGWQLPARYSDVMDEHHAVRQRSGVFDVSHMTIVDISGAEAAAFLRHLLANNIDKLSTPGKAMYSCMLNASGGILDDLIVYYFSDTEYRMVVNAATRDKDLQWIQQQASGFDVTISERAELALLALQGPQAMDQLTAILPELAAGLESLKPFHSIRHEQRMIARTGYTGEDGFEIVLPAQDSVTLWKQLIDAGVTPCGLGARDTLRLEAGMCLYGQDMDESVSPLESGLGWTVAWEPEDREFIGRQALALQRETGVDRKLAGLLVEQRTVLRNGYKVFEGDREVGVITSGTYSPTLEKPIGMARLATSAGDHLDVEIRGKRIPANVVKPVFVRNGKSLVA